MATEETFSIEVEKFIIDGLRETYPYMRIDAVRRAAKASAQVVHNEINEQDIHMQETKERRSFMSLRPEIRNRIYDYAVRPEKEGDGGVEGCRAILVMLDLNVATNPGSNPYLESTPWLWQPAITKVSAAMRKETLPMFYGSNRFVLKCDAQDVSRCRSHRLPKRSIRHEESASKESEWDFHYNWAQMWFQKIGRENMCLIKSFDVIFDSSSSEWTSLLRAFKKDMRIWTKEDALLSEMSVFIPARHRHQTFCLPFDCIGPPQKLASSSTHEVGQSMQLPYGDSVAFRPMPHGPRQNIFARSF